MMKVRKRWIILAAVLVLAAAIGGWYWHHTTTDEYKARQLVTELREYFTGTGPGLVRQLLIDWGLMKRKKPRDSDEIEEDLVALGKSAVPSLIEALKDKNSYVRISAACALGEIGPASEEAIPALIHSLKNKEPLTENELTETLVDIHITEEALVKIYVGEALGKIGPAAKTAIPALRETLKNEDEYVRWIAAVALVDIDPASAFEHTISILILGLKDQFSDNRSDSAEALGKIGPTAKDAIPALRESLEDETQRVREAAAEALKRTEEKAGAK